MSNPEQMKIGLVGMNSPVLRRVAEAVPEDPSQIAEIVGMYVGPMRDIIRAHGALGLAAPQLGVSRRFFMMRQAGRLSIVINPRIIRASARRRGCEEGCLSYPGYKAIVDRHTVIEVEWMTMMAEIRTMELKDQDAQVFQHELDHLDGRCIFP